MRGWSLAILMLVIPLVAQESEVAVSIPSAPAARVLDEPRRFKLQPELLDQLFQRLSGISERTGYQVCVVIFDSPIGTSVKESARWNVRVLIFWAGLLAGMLLIVLLVGAWIRRRGRRVTEQLVFPKVTVGMRLGAPCGGGKISSRSFDVRPCEKV